MSIKERLSVIQSGLPSHVALVAVSKMRPVAELMEAYQTGQRIFGENKIAEMAGKWEQMPKDIRWHMIGHVQTNKVGKMAPFVELVHSVDSMKLLEEIDRHALKNSRVIDCLLQVHIAQEESKFGLNEDELDAILTSSDLLKLKNINIIGLMGMASFTENQEQVRKEFEYLKSLFDRYPADENYDPRVLSMGMSDDYQIAISCGSNMVRIGSSIFGEN